MRSVRRRFAEGDVVELGDLPDHIAHPRSHPDLLGSALETNPSIMLPEIRPELLGNTFKDAKEQWVSCFEADYIASLLKKNKGNISHAAREADIDRKYFRKLMKKYGIASTED